MVIDNTDKIRALHDDAFVFPVSLPGLQLLPAYRPRTLKSKITHPNGSALFLLNNLRLVDCYVLNVIGSRYGALAGCLGYFISYEADMRLSQI